MTETLEFTAEAGIGIGNCTTSGAHPTVTPAGTANVYVNVLPVNPVTRQFTTLAAVAPEPVASNPVMYVVLPAAAANVAVAPAFATFPEAAVTTVAPAG
jgi:hypothetical protein